jgi:hypothetical protein
MSGCAGPRTGRPSPEGANVVYALLLASRNGDEEAKKLLDRHRPLMTEDELREAESMARQFVPKPTSSTQLITRRCRPQEVSAPGKKNN